MVAKLRTVECEGCGERITQEVRPGRPTAYCSPACLDFAKQTTRWETAARAYVAARLPAMRAEGSGGRVTPKGMRMRIRRRVMDAAGRVIEAAADGADDAREQLAAGGGK